MKSLVMLGTSGWFLCLMLGYTSMSSADYLDESAQAPYETCGYCHELDGNPRMTRYPRLAGQHSDYLIKQLEDFRSGERAGEMQATAELLSDSDIRIVAEYFSQQAVKLSLLDNQPDTAQQLARELYQQGDSKRELLACMHCHGAEGLGRAAIPRLAGQHEDYLIQQMQAFKSSQRNNDADSQMRVISRLLSEAEITALAAYLARLQPVKNSRVKLFGGR